MKKKLLLAGLAALTATALLASPAFAWHSNVSGTADCDQTTVTVTIPNENWVEDDTTASGNVSLGGQSKPWSIAGAGAQTLVFPGVNGGHATVTGTFNTGESAGGSADIAAVTDCEEETPPTTTTVPPTTTTKPPVDKPEKPQPIHGTATDKTRKAPTVKVDKPRPEDSGFTPPDQGPQNRTDFTG